MTWTMRITPRLSSRLQYHLWCISPDCISSDVESLKKGIIKTSKNKLQAPYTILLVGETGVGKSAALQFIANVLIGNDIDHYDFNTLDNSNERGGHGSQSQTIQARLYEFKSNNGILVSITIFERGDYV